MLAHTDMECFHTGLTEFPEPELAPRGGGVGVSPLDLSPMVCGEESCLCPLISLGLAGFGSFELESFEPWAPNNGLFCLELEDEVGLLLDAEGELRW